MRHLLESNIYLSNKKEKTILKTYIDSDGDAYISKS